MIWTKIKLYAGLAVAVVVAALYVMLGIERGRRKEAQHKAEQAKQAVEKHKKVEMAIKESKAISKAVNQDKDINKRAEKWFRD